MNRADLHTLVDILPEGALENAKRMLEHLQIWPPQQPPELERMRQIRQEQMERMRHSMRPGTTGGGGGGGSFDPATGYGHSGYTRWEEKTAIHETHHLYKGHEIAVTERLWFTEDGTAIHYVHEARGPKGDPIQSETTFDIE
jgi:hypothetical protein